MTSDEANAIAPKAALTAYAVGAQVRGTFADSAVEPRNIAPTDVTAARCFQRADPEDLIERVLARMAGAIEAVAARLPAGFPERLVATIFAGIELSAKQWSADHPMTR